MDLNADVGEGLDDAALMPYVTSVNVACGAHAGDPAIMEATVTVLESGRVVRTNPADGSYSVDLPSGTYTLIAESYGYYPQTRQVTLTEKGE